MNRARADPVKSTKYAMADDDAHKKPSQVPIFLPKILVTVSVVLPE